MLEVQVEGGELVMVYNCRPDPDLHDAGPQRKEQLDAPQREACPLAILLLEKADRFIKDLKEGSSNAGTLTNSKMPGGSSFPRVSLEGKTMKTRSWPPVRPEGCVSSS